MLLSRSADERYAPLTYRHLRVIQAVAQHGGIGRAAEILFMSQPAVTRALQQAEDLLGVKLFDRTPNGVMPTIFAEPVLKRAQSIHAVMRDTENELRILKSPELSQLRIGSGIHSTELWVNKAVAAMALADHQFKVTVERYDWSDLLRQIQDGNIDFGLGEISELETSRDWLVEPLAELDLYFICGVHHPLGQKQNITIADIRQYPMVGNQLVRKITEHFGGQIGRLGEIDARSGGMFSAIRMTSLNAIKLVIAESDGLAIMPIDSVCREIQHGQLIALSRANMPWLVGRIGFISSRFRPMSPAMKVFRKAVLDVEAERKVMQNLSA